MSKVETVCWGILFQFTHRFRLPHLCTKSRFAKNPQMAIFGCEYAEKRFLSWKTREKNVMENFFSCSYGVQKCHSLTININRSKAKRTHCILVHVKTNLPQQIKVYLIIWLSGFWALENPKVRVSWLSNLQPRLKNQRVTNSVLSKSCRKSNSHHFEPFPDEKYAKLTILDHLKWNRQFLYGFIFEPIFDLHMNKKKNFP